MATETPTPIRALGKAISMFHESHHPELAFFVGCTNKVCTGARVALEDMGVLAALMQRIGYDEELSYLACPGPRWRS